MSSTGWKGEERVRESIMFSGEVKRRRKVLYSGTSQQSMIWEGTGRGGIPGTKPILKESGIMPLEEKGRLAGRDLDIGNERRERSIVCCGSVQVNDRGGDEINEIMIRSYDFRNKVQYEILEIEKYVSTELVQGEITP